MEISPIKEATLRLRDEIVYPVRKLLQSSKTKYSFKEGDGNDRESSVTLVIRYPDSVDHNILMKQLKNMLSVRGFRTIQDRASQIFQEPGFPVRVVLTLNRDEEKLLSITVSASPA